MTFNELDLEGDVACDCHASLKGDSSITFNVMTERFSQRYDRTSRTLSSLAWGYEFEKIFFSNRDSAVLEGVCLWNDQSLASWHESEGRRHFIVLSSLRPFNRTEFSYTKIYDEVTVHQDYRNRFGRTTFRRRQFHRDVCQKRHGGLEAWPI